jgi:hypothetical protein
VRIIKPRSEEILELVATAENAGFAPRPGAG